MSDERDWRHPSHSAKGQDKGSTCCCGRGLIPSKGTKKSFPDEVTSKLRPKELREGSHQKGAAFQANGTSPEKPQG